MERRAILSGLSGEGPAQLTAAALLESCQTHFVLPHGILISGERRGFARLEKQGLRVKVLQGSALLEMGDWAMGAADCRVAEVPAHWFHYLLQLIAPPCRPWVEELEQLGLDVVEPVSACGLFVTGSRERLERAAALPFVSWSEPFLPAYRIHGSLKNVRGLLRYLQLAVYPPRETRAVAAALRMAGGKIVRQTEPPAYYRGQYGELLAEVEAEALTDLAALPAVRWLEFVPSRPGVEGERETQVAAGNLDSMPYPQKGPLPGYEGWLKGLGLSGGGGVTIAFWDSGVDANAGNNRRGHPDLRGRQGGFMDYGREPYPPDYLTHGTHVAAVAAGGGQTGQTDREGFLLGMGVAPRARFLNQNVLVGPWPPDWAEVARAAAARGATIVNNSWGAGKNPGAGYTLTARTFDRLALDALGGTASPRPLTFVFSAGNAGPGPQSITPPKELKNGIVVGNSLGPAQPHPSCGGDLRGIYGASSRGPARDGRILPTLVAPGTGVPAALAQVSTRQPMEGTGEPDAGDRSLVRHGYIALTGTSMSAALVSGACALLTEWWRRYTGGRDPSPALLRALLINGAQSQEGGQDWQCLNSCRANNLRWSTGNGGIFSRPLSFQPVLLESGRHTLRQRPPGEYLQEGEWSVGPSGRLYLRTYGGVSPVASDAPPLNALSSKVLGYPPDSAQGWGRVNLSQVILHYPAAERGSKLIFDQEIWFEETGQEFILRVAPIDTSRPLRITLAWSDAPAAAGSGRSLVNDLDLEVREMDARRRLYKGNMLRRGFSRCGGDYDSCNNTEAVILRQPQGIYEIRVVAAALRGLARPPFGCRQRGQSFALVVDNGQRVADDPLCLVPLPGYCAGQGPPERALRIACKQMLVSLPCGSRVGVPASAGVETVLAMETVTGNKARRSISAAMLAERQSGGCIPLDAGFRLARELLLGEAGRKAVVLFAAGRENNCDPCREAEAKTAFWPPDIPVYCCLVGRRGTGGSARLRDGRCYYAPDLPALNRTVNFLRAELTGEELVLNERALSNGENLSALVDEGAEEVTFFLCWTQLPKRGMDAEVRLTGPGGRPVHPNSSWLYRQTGVGHALFRIRRPEPGYWQLALYSAAGNYPYTAAVFLQSGLKLKLWQDGSGIRAAVTDQGLPVADWQGAAWLEGGETEGETVLAHSLSQGVERFFPLPGNIAGPCNVLVRADGISSPGGAPFSRLKMRSLPF
jgi:hypothetical protein